MSSSLPTRGVKRKRPDLPVDEDAARLTGKLFHGLKEVKKAAKKAKSFEAQKVVKRLKATAKPTGRNEQPKAVLEAELEALKAIDHEAIGAFSLKNKLKKDKVLSSDPSVKSAILEVFSSGSLSASESPSSKLESRLLSSKVLSGEVNAVILSLRSILRSKDGDGDDGESTEGIEVLEPSAPKPKYSNQAKRDPTPVGSEDDNEHSPVIEDLSGKHYAQFHSSTDEGLENSNTSDSEIDSDNDESDSGDQTTSRASRSTLPGTSASQDTGVESTFLPTLSHGFIPGDSDTDWSDGEAKVADGTRKNRRGQRARRAIWEKKYGKNAKHLKKQEEDESRALSDRRNFKKPVQGPKHEYRPQANAFAKQRSQVGNTSDVTGKRPLHQEPKSKGTNDRPLHPSWIAKIRLKEKTSAAIVPSEGKRIKFDE